MLSKILLLTSLSGTALGQTVVNGAYYVPCGASVALNPTYLANYLDINCAVTSVTISPGTGGQAFHLTVKMDGGSVSGIASNMDGGNDNLLPNPTGSTSYRMVWDVPTAAWKVTRMAVKIPTKTSDLINDAGFVTSGTPGPQGPIGLTGATGPTGATGGQGIQGVPGNTGPAGAAGLVGATGATGPQGVVGAQGIQGATGTPGPSDLTGTTGSIGGSLLALGACATGTASVTGAIKGRRAEAFYSDGSLLGGGLKADAAVTANGTVTVELCAIVASTPAAKTFNVYVSQN